MERILKQYDKECMKMAILKHEETFRQQVHELHRLYRVQKLLMQDFSNAELKRQAKSSYFQTRHNNQLSHTYREQRKLRRSLDLELPAEGFNGDDVGRDVMLENEHESDLELTLATGSSRRKKETSYTSDSGASFSSSSAESSALKLIGHECRMFQMPDMNMCFQHENKNGFDSKEPIRKDRIEQPPWLFRCLSLNTA